MRQDKLTTQVSSGAGRCAVAGARPRPPDHRARPRDAGDARQQGGTVRPLLLKAGANLNKLRSELLSAARQAAEGRGHARGGACLERSAPPAQRHRQARAAARRSVHLERAVRARRLRGPRPARARPQGLPAWCAARSRRRSTKCAAARRSPIANAEEQRGGAREIHRRSHRARRLRQARSGHRSRR